MTDEVFDIPVALDRFLRRVFVAAHEEIKEVDLPITPQDIKLLMFIHDQPDTSVSKIVSMTHRDKSQITRKVNELEKKGLVARTASAKDQRVSNLSLTSAGTEMAEKLRTSMHQVFTTILKPLTQEEQKSFAKILKKIS